MKFPADDIPQRVQAPRILPGCELQAKTELELSIELVHGTRRYCEVMQEFARRVRVSFRNVRNIRHCRTTHLAYQAKAFSAGERGGETIAFDCEVHRVLPNVEVSIRDDLSFHGGD